LAFPQQAKAAREAAAAQRAAEELQAVVWVPLPSEHQKSWQLGH